MYNQTDKSILNPHRFLFAFLLLLSGFASISYEILYARILGDLIGDQWAVYASILLTFLLGIGLGTLYSHRFWRYLWLLEAGVGLYAVAFAFSVPVLDKWLYSTGFILGRDLGSNIFRCGLLLSTPSFLIGCSLPLFAGYLSRLTPGLAFSRAYSLHSFGAALTVLVVEFGLIRMAGIRATVVIAALLNTGVAGCLFLFFKPIRNVAPTTESYIHFPRKNLIALALASVASAIFQLLIIKIAEFLLGPFRETFAIVLSLVLLGIAIGASLVRRYGIHLGQLMVANLVGLVWLLVGYKVAASGYAHFYPGASESYLLTVSLKILTMAILMGIPAITFGATIPALITSQENVAKESGRLLFVSSLANVAGFLLMVFFLHQYFDYSVLIIIIASVSALGLIVYLDGKKVVIAGSVVLMAAMLWVNNNLWDEELLYMGHKNYLSSEKFRDARKNLVHTESFKGRQDVFAIRRDSKGAAMFFINGYHSMNLNTPLEQIVGAFSSMFAPRTDRAMVLGLGSGATAGTVGLLFDHTDAVEVNPVVLDNLYRMKKYNFDIENMPKLTVINDDGIHFAKTASHKYSLILNTVTSPRYFSSSKLYTDDFFKIVRSRLTSDGIYVTWVDSRIGDQGVDIILKSLSQSFKSCWLGYIASSYYLLICSPEQIVMHHPELAGNNDKLRKYLFGRFGVMPEWLPYQVLSTDAFSLLGDTGVAVNTFDYPAIEFAMAQDQRGGFDGFKKRLWKNMNVDDIRKAFDKRIPWNPTLLGLHAYIMLGPSRLTSEWLSRLNKSIPNFDQLYGSAMLSYYAEYAAKANSADSHDRFGRCLLELGQYQNAIKEFTLALAIEPRYKNTHMLLGNCYEGLGEFDEALKYYRQEIAIDPNDAIAYLVMGRTFVSMGRYKDALAAFDDSLAQEPSSEAFFGRGTTLEYLGQIAAAKDAYNQALSIEPGYTPAKEAIARMNP